MRHVCVFECVRERGRQIYSISSYALQGLLSKFGTLCLSKKMYPLWFLNVSSCIHKNVLFEVSMIHQKLDFRYFTSTQMPKIENLIRLHSYQFSQAISSFENLQTQLLVHLGFLACVSYYFLYLVNLIMLVKYTDHEGPHYEVFYRQFLPLSSRQHHHNLYLTPENVNFPREEREGRG